MPNVTIEGSLTPCVELATGKRKTVALTDRIRGLVHKGYVTIVSTEDDELVQAAPPAPVVEVVEVPPADTAPEAPARNASAETWRDWVAANVPSAGGERLADASRDELIEIWDAHVDGS